MYNLPRVETGNMFVNKLIMCIYIYTYAEVVKCNFSYTIVGKTTTRVCTYVL